MKRWSGDKIGPGFGRGYVLVIAVLVMAASAAVLLPWHAAPVHAGKYPGYAAKIAKCKGKCGRTAGAMNACRGRFVKSGVKACRNALKGALAACAGDKACRSTEKSRALACARDAGAGAGPRTKSGKCSGCCQRSRGGGECFSSDYLAGRFYGSRRYKGGLVCNDNDNDRGSGRPSPAFDADYADLLRMRVVEWLRSWLGTGTVEGSLRPGGDR